MHHAHLGFGRGSSCIGRRRIGGANNNLDSLFAHKKAGADDRRQRYPIGCADEVVSSFPTMLETVQHIYQWDQYYLVHLKGGSVELDAIVLPQSYAELEEAWRRVHAELAQWATTHLSERKDILLHGWETWPTWMIVMQIANHASHHLGQMLTLIRQAGYAPVQSDWTDLILYYLQRFPVEQTTA